MAPTRERSMAAPGRGPAKAARAAVSPVARVAPVAEQAEMAVAWLRQHGTRVVRDGMARYGLPSERAFGVSVGGLHRYARELGRNHPLALALWGTGGYEARMLATFIDEPARVTSGQMDRWARDFDNWGICDTACFHLFDRTPHAWAKVGQWAGRKEQFVKRAAFALLASLVVHDKAAPDSAYITGLGLIERAAADDRNFVMKGANWALRCIGKRSPALHREALAVAARLAARPEPAPRWVGKDALRELRSAPVARRLSARRASGA